MKIILIKRPISILRFLPLIFLINAFMGYSQSRPYHKLDKRQQYKMAQMHIKRNSYYEALKILQDLYKADQKNVGLLQILASTYYTVRDYKSASKYYNEIIALDKTITTTALYHYGLCMFSMGDYEGAYTSFKTFYDKPQKGNTFKTEKDLAFHKMKACKEASLIASAKNEKVIITHLGDHVNSSYAEFAPCLRDSNTIIFASLQSDTVLSYDFGEAHFNHMELMESEKDDSENWGKAKPVKKLNKKGYNTANGNFNPERNKFYFTRCKPNGKHKMICHIYVSDYKNNKFSKPTKLGNKINTTESTSTQPSISHVVIDGVKYDVLYFVSDRKGGNGGLDIYYAVLNLDGTVRLLGNLGSKINTPGNETSPYYDDDLKKLFFSSDYHYGLGGYDIFNAEGAMSTWGKPVNLGSPYNTSYDDTYFTLVPGKHSAFIASNRPGVYALVGETCCEDLFSANFLIQSNLNINVYDEKKTKLKSDSVKITIIDKAGKEAVQIKDSADQYYIINPNQKYNVAVILNNDTIKFAFSTSRIGNVADHQYSDTAKARLYSHKNLAAVNVFDLFLRRERQKADSLLALEIKKETVDTFNLKPVFKFVSKKAEIKDTTKSETFDYDNFTYEFYFAYKEKDFMQTQKQNFNYILKLIKNNPQYLISIEAHTDNIGGDEYNQWLSESRAEKIKNFLIENGVSKKRITSKGYGESQPVAENTFTDGSDNPEGRAKNRRGIIRLMKPQNK